MAAKKLYYSELWKIEKVPQTVLNQLNSSWVACKEINEKHVERNTKLDDLMCSMMLPEHLRPRDWHFNTEKFLLMMNIDLKKLPDYFHGDDYHIILEYYIQVKNGLQHRLCDVCFSVESKFYKPYSNNLWKDLNITYYHARDHWYVNDGQKVVEDYIWDPNNWCSRCTIEPLFFVFDDKEDCYWETDFHCQRKRYNSEHHFIDTYNDGYVEMKLLKGHEVPDDVYRSALAMEGYLKMN